MISMSTVEEMTVSLFVNPKNHKSINIDDLTKSYRYKVHLKEDEDGRYVATIPQLPGAVTDGATKQEAMKNIREAALGILDCLSCMEKD